MGQGALLEWRVVRLRRVLMPASSDTSLTADTPPSQQKTTEMYQVDKFDYQKGMKVEGSIDK